MLSIFLHFLISTLAQNPPPALSAAVHAYTQSKGDQQPPVFKYALTDLNGDGQPDAVVLLLGSYCGSGGCNMLVLRRTKDAFALVSASTVTSEPIRVLPEKSNGWNTLLVFSKGKGDVLMPFSGKRYPSNPSLQPKATAAYVAGARTLAFTN
jgi:hypothetical protein